MRTRRSPPKLASLSNKNMHEQGIAHAPVLSERERHRILYEWNDTFTMYPDACVHELFEQQVARDPGAVAVICKDRQLTYQELNQRANQVAQYLRKRGVGPESLVGVCLRHSPEMVIALLGVWKAGGAYVPFDPAYPQDRLSFMVNDTAAILLLTDEKCRNLFPSAGDRAVSLDSVWPVIAQENISNPTAVATPSNLAYVMYTSGSTGQPKGAMIMHSSLVNYLCWAIKTYVVEAGSSVPVHSSIAFDSTVASLYPPLLSGGAIELLPEDIGAQSLVAALRQKKNRGKVVITPAHLELLSLQLGAEEICGTTMNLVIAGDTLRAEGLSRWRDHAPTTRLFNEYGPTEATVGCCSHEVGTDYRRDGVVPIGRPIANTQLYVLDSNLQVVPPGVTGELYVGGAGVARGYLNRPELTRERFLLDPFSRRAGARLYRTGDLARYCEDGTLECLGRVDDQVKVRGFRIELGEIETALLGYPGVRSCVILVREDAPENKQLVCYLVAGDSESPDANALRKFLRQRLPEYMVPVHFVFLDSLPLTRNGKIDRKALPAPSRESIRSAREFIAPRTETEKKLAAIWIKLLKVKCIGIYEDFFDLGGDSLLAVRAMVQTQELFGVAPSMQAFFPRFTIAGLAEALSSGEECRDRLAYVVPVQSRGQKPPFFWIGAATLAAALSVQLGSNQPVFSIGFEPSIIDQLKTPYRVEELAKYLVLAVREKQTHGPYHLGGFCQDGIFAIEVARQLTAAGEDVGLLALFEPLNPRHSLRAKIEAGLKRTWIRIRLRFAELRKIELGEFSQYACSRWRNLKWLVTHSLWHIHGSFQNWKRKPHPLGLERILFLAASSYKPNALACPTVIFRSKDWPISSAGDPYFGWRKLLTGRTEIDEVPGDHVGIFREPYVQALVMKLRICLEKARKQKGTY